LPRDEVLSGDYVGVKSKVFIVCVFVASVSLVAHGFYCQVGVVDLVYEVEDAKGGESD